MTTEAEVLLAALEEDGGCRQALGLACDQLDSPAGFVSLFDGDREHLVVRQGVIPSILPRAEALVPADVVEEPIVVLEDLRADPRAADLCLRWAMPECGFAAAAPLLIGKDVVGCLVVLDDHPHTLDDAHRRLLVGLAGLIMTGIRYRTPRPAPAEAVSQATPDLLQSETYLLHTMMDHLPDAIYFKDRQSRFVRVNRATARRHGWNDPEDADGQTDFDVFAEEHARAAYEDEQRILETGDPVVDKEEEETWPDGSVTWVSTTKLPLRDAAGAIIGTFGLSRDVTDRKVAQEAVIRHAVELEAINSRHGAELSLASELQRAFLPERYPRFPAEEGDAGNLLEFCHVYRPVEVVGGDYFSIQQLTEQSAGVLVCDVVGHGVRAALVTAMLNAVVHDLRDVAGDPAEFLRRLNERLWASLGGRFEYGFVTAFYLVADAAASVVRFAGAGHPHPLLLRRGYGRVDPLLGESGTTGQALLLRPDPLYVTEEIALSPNDAILLFTDGVYEVRGPHRATYGTERLEALLAGHLAETTPALMNRILTETLAFSRDEHFQDDVCMVGVDLASP